MPAAKYYNGKTLKQWSRKTGIKKETIIYRMNKGMSIIEAVSVPVSKGGSIVKTQYEVDGKTFTDSKGNEFIVDGIAFVDDHHVKHYNIRFLKSGYKTQATSAQLRGTNHGKPQDRLSPSVHNVGIMGYAYGKENPKLFDVWRAMIARCYNPKNPSYKNYGAKGVTVCERWKRFDFFLEDVKSLQGFNQKLIDEGKLVMDKDLIDRSKMLYSPATCCFIKRGQNTSEALYRRWNEKKCRD